MGLAELTPFPRVGFKGWNIAPWLTSSWRRDGAKASNRAYTQADGTRIARLAPGEALLSG